MKKFLTFLFILPFSMFGMINAERNINFYDFPQHSYVFFISPLDQLLSRMALIEKYNPEQSAVICEKIIELRELLISTYNVECPDSS